MFNVIIFGPPGSGKGTQSAGIVKEYELKHVSTGDLLRTEIAAGSALGLKAKAIMDRGELVSDEVILGMIGDVFDKNPGCKGFLFDGFPRTKAQAGALDKLLNEKGAGVDLVLAMDVGEEELVKRLLNRGKTSNRSDDANEQVVRARIEEYRRKTHIVLTHYDEQKKVIHIKGEGGVEDVFKQISGAIADVRKKG